jgi:hypothetical protein
MPEPPEGEADLRDLSAHFMRAEGYVLALLGEAATGDRHSTTKLALGRLADLRRLDLKGPVASAYLAAHPRGRPDAVRDLAGSLAKRLDTGAQTAADGVRDSFRKVTPANVAELVMSPLTAAVDARGARWALGAWADMNCTTIGRQATSRGITHNVGEGNTVTINAGDCSYCQEFAGEAVIGEDALPPFHPNCSCTATAAES